LKAALGLIETVGSTAAITALDAASKAANVELVGYEKVIGKVVSVTVQVAGEVAAVRAAVEAGAAAANRVGTVVSQHVIPRPHDEVDKLIARFQEEMKNKKAEKDSKGTKSKSSKKTTKKSTDSKKKDNQEEEEK